MPGNRRHRLEAAAAAFLEVENELKAAVAKHPRFNSAHEGWAVLREEVDELWDEVRRKESERSHQTMRIEARQVAAMAVRFMVECCDA
jgi:hypothetical protein